jgi:hypothetical protein
MSVKTLDPLLYVYSTPSAHCHTIPSQAPYAREHGQMCYDETQSQMFVWDSGRSDWLPIYNEDTMIQTNLPADSVDILEWAREKMHEEQQLRDLMERHPELKDAYEEYRMTMLWAKIADDAQKSRT